uniref:Uncharacterized protein n=1 Tax=Anguilla anguilla TaxID=7936 RepID=A0A0E9RRZ4_ANGAN
MSITPRSVRTLTPVPAMHVVWYYKKDPHKNKNKDY